MVEYFSRHSNFFEKKHKQKMSDGDAQMSSLEDLFAELLQERKKQHQADEAIKKMQQDSEKKDKSKDL